MGINTGEGGLQTELEQSPREALINFMAGAGVSDPRPIKTSIEGIELACAELDASTVTCGWADLTSIGTAAWRGDGVDIDEAAGRTEDFLGELRVVDELPD